MITRPRPKQRSAAMPHEHLSASVFEAVAFPMGDSIALGELVCRFAADLQHQARARRVLPVSRDAIPPEAFSAEYLLANPVWACRLVQAVEAQKPLAAADAPVRSPMPLAGTPGISGIDPQVAWPFPEGERLGALDSDEVGSALVSAVRLLRRVWPEAALDVSMLFRGVRFARSGPGHMQSGSSALCPFVIMLVFDPGDGPVPLADALVHEVTHIKLRLAMRQGHFCEPDGPLRYRHPWRTDPRPLVALLVAAHAFVAVHAFYTRLVTLHPTKRFVAYEERMRAEVGEALNALSAADNELPPLGRRLTASLRSKFAASAPR
jgi:hypothetical protein